MKLKTARYFGKFYEFEDGLGWMPFYKVAMIRFMGHYNSIKWVPQKMVNFEKRA